MAEIVLIGMGHAHLYVMSCVQRFVDEGHELTLVSPGNLWYSGMATGMLSGRYTPEEDQVDIASIVRHFNVRWVQERAITIDRAAKHVRLSNGTVVDYDLVSLNVGSMVQPPFPVAPTASVWHAKPIENLYRLRRRLEVNDQLNENKENLTSLAVIGGGATGVEIAANLKVLLDELKGPCDLTLISADNTLLKGSPKTAGWMAGRVLNGKNIEIIKGKRVDGISTDFIEGPDGWRMPYHHAVIATGLTVNPLVRRLGLPFDEARGLIVSETLQSVSDSCVFAAGDCAEIEGHPRPKLGVFGVRAAPFLADNLLAMAGGRTLSAYSPQKRYLSILNLGDGTGLALWGGLWWRSKGMMRWKERLDRSFMSQYQVESPLTGEAPLSDEVAFDAGPLSQEQSAEGR